MADALRIRNCLNKNQKGLHTKTAKRTVFIRFADIMPGIIETITGKKSHTTGSRLTGLPQQKIDAVFQNRSHSESLSYMPITDSLPVQKSHVQP